MDLSARARRALLCGCLLLVVAAVSTAAVLLRPGDARVATWWPAAGVGIVALVLAPRSWWPALTAGVVAATLPANLLGGHDLGLSLALTSGNAAEALVAALVIGSRYGDARRRVDTATYVRLVVGATLGAAAMAAVAEVGLLLQGERLGTVAPTVLPSHLASTLVVVPLLLLVPGGLRCRATAELALQAVALGAVLLVGATVDGGLGALFLPIPLLAWAALRACPLATTVELAVVASVVTWSSLTGDGSFALLRGDAGLGNQPQTYLACLALLAVPAALVSDHRRQLLARLDAERELSATTLATTAAIIVVTDPEGRVERVNAALERLTGWTADDLVGLAFGDCPLVPPERRAIVTSLFDDVLGGTVPATREADVMTVHGERLRVVWSNNVVTDAAGGVVHVVCTATDVTGERSSAQLVQHLLGSPKASPMLSLDHELRIALYNAASEQLFGVPAEQAVGRPLTTLVCPEVRADMEAALERASEASRESRAAAPLEHDWSWMRPDGTVVRLGASVSAVVDAGGRQTATLLVANDVTRQVEQEEALQRALQTERRAVERLRRLDSAKNEFVSTVSHELRTPTTSIVGYTEMLRDELVGEVSSDQRELLEVIARNGTRLIAVADDLLTLAGLESRGTETAGASERVDLTEIVRMAQQAVVPLVGERSLAVAFAVPDEPVDVVGDPAHLDRVVLNLLSNAVKFTPDGGEVRCRLHRTGQEAVIEVSDTGIGIPETELPDLFTKFFRSSTAQEHAIPGTGLGLSIIDRIVADHDGSIVVRSAEGAGTTFTVRLPLADASVGPVSAG